LLGENNPEAAQMLSSIDGQYYFIDHTLFDQLQTMATEDTAAPKLNDIKTEDVINFMKKLGEVNKDYVFTTDPDKAIFSVKEELGKETVDRRETYHYKVALDKENLKKWKQAVCDKIVDDAFYKAVSPDISDEDRKKECEDTSDFDSIDENTTADVWVDLSTKLIRTVRIVDEDSKTEVDFGLLYESGDEYPFYVTVKGGGAQTGSTAAIKLTLNTKTDSITFNIDGTSDDTKLSANLTFEPGDANVEFSKPENTKSLMELLAPFLGGLPGASPASAEEATDLNLE
jgi:hypothetical protein